MNSRIEGFTTILQIRIVTMFAARDNGVNTCNLREFGQASETVKLVTGDRPIPDKGEIIPDNRVRSINGWTGCHFLVVVCRDR